jgi:hypothetical protein
MYGLNVPSRGYGQSVDWGRSRPSPEHIPFAAAQDIYRKKKQIKSQLTFKNRSN